MTINYIEKDCPYNLQFSSIELEDISDIDELLLSHIREKYYQKCTAIGYISDIIKIISRSDPIITNRDLSADVTFSLVVRVRIANYNVGDKISCKINSLNMNIGSYISTNKPFIIFLIATDNLPSVKIGSVVELVIVAKKIEQDEIHLIGELL